MKKFRLSIIALFALSLTTLRAQKIELQKPADHPMLYYVSVPKGWSANKQWPVVMLFEAAEKEYRKNLERFAEARKDMPFILVQPIHTNNGNQGRRDPQLFPYTTETWDYIDKVGDCQFNEEGIQAVIKDVNARYHAESRWYVTGFEAGTHMLWYMVFKHPDQFKAAAPVAGNWRARCVDENSISKNEAKAQLVIKSFVGAQDEVFGSKGAVYGQWIAARDLALKSGYPDVSEKVVSGVGHEPMPVEVLKWFQELEEKK